jgi:outer membrane protein assembly factor BamB
LAVVLVPLRYLLPLAAGDAEIVGVPLAIAGVIGGSACAAAIAVWWLFFSRAAWRERVGVLALMAIAFFATQIVADVSVRRGMMGLMPLLYGVPLLGLALVAWAAAARSLSGTPRYVTLVVAVALACFPMTIVRSAGIRGVGAELHFRWTATPEDQLLARETSDPPPQARPAEKVIEPAPTAPAPAEAAPPAVAVSKTPAAWPGFRGPKRDGIIHGLRINNNWTSSPPALIWKRAIGPGWSSFAVSGDLVFTQEQRGDDEVVSCYRLSTGEPVWRHRDPVRFWEAEGGAGPRATRL